MATFRCDWCGRFYSSPLPDGSACDDHQHEYSVRLRQEIDRFNARLKRRQEAVSDGE